MKMKTIGYGLPLALMLCFFAASSFAQSPSMSWGEQLLSITGDECMRRTPLAYRAEGFNPDSPSVNTTYATKGIHGAYIRCIGEPEKGRTRVIIVVSSTASDHNVPGAERVKLQGRMDQSGGTTTSATKWRLTAVVPSGQPNAGTYWTDIDLTERNGDLTGSGKWSNGPTSNFTGTIRNGEVVLYRVDNNGFRGTFWGRVTADGRMEGTGRNDPASPGGNNVPYSWILVRL